MQTCPGLTDAAGAQGGPAATGRGAGRGAKGLGRGGADLRGPNALDSQTLIEVPLGLLQSTPEAIGDGLAQRLPQKHAVDGRGRLPRMGTGGVARVVVVVVLVVTRSGQQAARAGP